MTADPAAPAPSARSPVGRGQFLSDAAAAIGIGAGLGMVLLAPAKASAVVQFETERYGDKELKIATVNKLRQQIRNMVSGDCIPTC